MASRKPLPPLRKPPTPAEAAFLAAAPHDGESRPVTVSHHESPQGDTSHPTPSLPRGRQVQASGRVVRRITVYLPGELGERLDAHCEREDRELSWVVARALEAWLSTRA